MTQFEYTCFRLEHPELDLPPITILPQQNADQLPSMTWEELFAKRCARLLTKEAPFTRRSLIVTSGNLERWGLPSSAQWYVDYAHPDAPMKGEV